MKAQKLIVSAVALSIALTCISVFSQDTPLPAPDTATQSPAKNPRAGYTPLADGSRQTSANKTGAMAAAANLAHLLRQSGARLYPFWLTRALCPAPPPAKQAHFSRGTIVALRLTGVSKDF